MKTKGQIAYEAWNCRIPGDHVPWDRLDPRDHEHHIQWAEDYERMKNAEEEQPQQRSLEFNHA